MQALSNLNEEDFDDTINDMASEISGINADGVIVATTIAEIVNESSIEMVTESSGIKVEYLYDTSLYSVAFCDADLNELVTEHLSTLQISVNNGNIESSTMLNRLDIMRSEFESMLSAVNDHRMVLLNNI